MKQYERIIYDLLKSNPKLKQLVRDTYQYIFSLVPQKKISTVAKINERSGFFFGFHDKNPWSFNDEYLLAVRTKNETREPQAGEKHEIGVFTGENHMNFRSVCFSGALNWQQGNMLQWVGKSTDFIFNDIANNRNISKLVDINGKEKHKFEVPISSVCPKGEYATSYNYYRLQKYFKGYGYPIGQDDELQERQPVRHGLSLLNLQTGNYKLLFSLKELASIHTHKSMDDAYHFITHSLFNKEGNRFYFFHRWANKNNLIYTRMYTCDTDGNNLHVFPTSGMVSHVAWKNNNELLAYCSIEGVGDRYVLFTDQTNNYQIIGEKELSADGHPSFCPTNNNIFITDTYPDRYRLSYLILYNLINNSRINLAKLRQPMIFRDELRCDLHPRWNWKGDIICFDSAHNNMRSLCTLNLKLLTL